MLNLKRYVPYLLLLGYGITQLLLLSVNTLPWFDETFFASITNSLTNGNGFSQTIMPFSDESAVTYGPVYFLLTGISTTIGGFNPFSFRIINLIAAWLVVLVCYKFLFRDTKNKYFLLVIVLFDPLFLLNAQSGRMDMLASLFAVLAYLPYWNKQYHTSNLVMASVSSVMAVLTTPRIAFILVPLCIYYSITLIKQKRIIVLLVCFALILVVYSIWVVYAFGNYGTFIDYYINTPKANDQTLFQTFIGGGRLVPKLQLPILLSLIVLSVAVIKKQGIRNLDFHMIPVALYYILISDTGLYSAMVIVLVYFVIFSHLLLLNYHRLLKYFGYSLIIINIGIFSVKTSSVLLNLNERSHFIIEQWIKSNIKPHSKVIGSDQYYYACRNNACDFQYIERRGDLNERVNWHREVYQPDYIIIGKNQSDDIVKAYLSAFSHDNPIEIECFKLSPVNDSWLNLFRKIKILAYGSYKGQLYKVNYKTKKTDDYNVAN
ncbi:MAG: hypothetical protein N4A71_25280 [Carboxylicivirga sp.]|nr:hypothetical protein [Carboxylicivirga sp.]